MRIATESPRGLTLNGNGGANTLNVYDQSKTTAETYHVNALVLYVRPFSEGITYAGMTTVVLNGGQGGNTYEVYGTGAGSSYTVNGGTGGATFNVGSITNSLDNIQGALTVNGQGRARTH